MFNRKAWRRRHHTADTHRMAVLMARSVYYDAVRDELMYAARQTSGAERSRCVREARSFARYSRKCMRLYGRIRDSLLATARAR